MKLWLLFLAGLLVIGLVVMKTTEKFQPEFLDRSQITKTIATEDANYEQRTNHMDPAPYQSGPALGMESPFQVNQYRAYIQ